jgi:hypothetical protein
MDDEQSYSNIFQAASIASGVRPAHDDLYLDSDSDSDASNEASTRDNNLTGSSSKTFCTELQQTFLDVVVVIDCLYKLSMSIRNGVSRHDRLVKAGSINTSFFETWDIEHVRAKFPATKVTVFHSRKYYLLTAEIGISYFASGKGNFKEAPIF